MIDGGKRNLIGVGIDAVDYDAVAARVLEAAEAGRPLALSALAVHGVMECVDDPELRYRVNRLDVVTPDGQPVRWALNLLHRTGLADRCYGPTLMLRLVDGAAQRGLPVYLYGSRSETLDRLESNLRDRAPGLDVAGTTPSVFGQVTSGELDRIADRIRSSGARIVFVGLGCPRQETFAFEMRDRLGMPVLAVGAAFDYHAGLLREPPMFVQRWGLQWMWRLASEPSRLWRRYARTNPRFVLRVLRQRLGATEADLESGEPPSAEAGFA